MQDTEGTRYRVKGTFARFSEYTDVLEYSYLFLVYSSTLLNVY